MNDSISLVVEGNPKALARPVVGRARGGSGRVWLRDPNQEAKRIFREKVQRQVHRENSSPEILFGANTPIVIDIIFILKSPLNHFVNCDHERGCLKPEAMLKWPVKPDLDNLDKFVLDSSRQTTDSKSIRSPASVHRPDTNLYQKS